MRSLKQIELQNAGGRQQLNLRQVVVDDLARYVELCTREPIRGVEQLERDRGAGLELCQVDTVVLLCRLKSVPRQGNPVPGGLHLV